MINLNFIYNEKAINIQCKREEYMKDIFKRYLKKINKDINDVFFIFNGNEINEELKLEEINNKNNEIKILVNDINDTIIENKEFFRQSKDIICPKCGEICLLNIKDYKIILNQCKNKHKRENILFDEYDNLQKINEINIICGECKKIKMKYIIIDYIYVVNAK